MFSGIAAQLTATNGRVLRGERPWMNRASTSLPVPDSPTISTVQSLAATRRARSASRCELAEHVTGSVTTLASVRALTSACAGDALSILVSPSDMQTSTFIGGYTGVD